MVAILTLFSYAFDFAEHGGQIVGVIPTGMPSLSIPAMSGPAILLLLPAAFIIAMISFMEAMSSCKVIAASDRQISIGKPLANEAMYILDKNLNPVPIGVPSGRRVFHSKPRRPPACRASS